MFSLILGIALITGCGGGGGGGTGHWTPADSADTTAPTVTAVAPADASPAVAINTKIITAEFSEAMDPASLTTTSFILECPAGTPIAGAVTYLAAGNLATLTLPPAPDLPLGVTCTATVTAAAKDVAGNAMAANYVWTFVTGAVDATRPTVLLTVPETTVPGPTAVAAIPTSITAVFSEDMAPASIAAAALTTFTLKGPGATVVAGAVTYVASSRTAIFTPGAALIAGTTYTATISTVATDLAGNALAADYVWSFTLDAAAVPDTTRPTVTAVVPTSPPSVAINTKIISAAFSEPMNPATLTTTSFKLECPAGTPVTATGVSYQEAGNVVTLTLPAATNLPASTVCTATVTSAAMDLAGNQLSGNQGVFPAVSNYVWTFTTSAAADTTKPTVTSVVPANNAAPGVAPLIAINTKTITAAFSEPMNSSSLTAASFKVSCGGTLATGTVVSYLTAGSIATLTLPSATNLPPNSVCTVTVTTAAKDIAGNLLAGNQVPQPGGESDYVWTFNTDATPDTTRPTVTARVPASGALSVAANTKSIVATFSELMNAGSLTTSSFKVECPAGVAVTGTSISYTPTGMVATLTLPAATNLPSDTVCTVTISTVAKDVAGNTLAGGGDPLVASAHVWTFTTGSPPTVLAVAPLTASIGVCNNWTLSATFSEPMASATVITPGNFTLQTSGPPLGLALAGNTTYDAATKMATFKPTLALTADTFYTATIKGGTNGVADTSGDVLAADKVWTFRTGTGTCTGTVELGAAAPFGGFGGGAGMTNEGILTTVQGDIGTTGVSTLITGFHDSTGDKYIETGSNIGAVSGRIYTAPPPPVIFSPGGPFGGTAATFLIAQNAAAAALTAWNNLSPASMPGGIDPGAGQLGGLTLQPGIYRAAGGTFLLTGSDLTLDALGDPNAVWVFQAASSLTIGAPALPRSINLINGASAKNVYWYVAAAARIEDRSNMVGTIIADAGVTISTSGNALTTSLLGRALGLNASVTLVNTIITLP